MEPRQRVQGLLERTFRSISTPFETIFHHEVERSRNPRFPRHSESPDVGDQNEVLHNEDIDPEGEAEIEMPLQIAKEEDLQIGDNGEDLIVSPINLESPQEIFIAAEEPGFPDGPNRLVIIEKQGTSSLLFALKQETVTQMINTIRAARKFAPLETEMEDLRRSIGINEAHIDLMKDNLNTMKFSVSTKQEFEESLQERECVLQKDIGRKTGLERDFDVEGFKLRLLKEEMQETLEQILMDANFLESAPTENPYKKPEQPPPSPEDGAHSPDPGLSEAHGHMSDPEEAEASPNQNTKEAEREAAIEEYENVAKWVRGAEEEFLERQDAYEQDLFNFSDTTSKTEIDLFHVNRGRELAKRLNQAEEAWEKARSRAKALGLLRNNSYQESDFVDDVDDGYRLSQDPSGKLIQPGREVIEAWAEEIAGPKSDEDEEMPDVDHWDIKSIDPWDSLSVVAEGKQRTRIDRWQSMCEATEHGVPGEHRVCATCELSELRKSTLDE